MRRLGVSLLELLLALTLLTVGVLALVGAQQAGRRTSVRLDRADAKRRVERAARESTLATCGVPASTVAAGCSALR